MRETASLEGWCGFFPERRGPSPRRNQMSQPTCSIMVARCVELRIRCLWPARSDGGVLPRLRPGGGALAFEQLQDALRILPDCADVAEHQLGRSVLRHPLKQLSEIEAAGTRCKALGDQCRACDGGAAYQQLLRSSVLCNAAQDAKALFHLSDHLSYLTRIVFCDLPFAGLCCDLAFAGLF